MHFHGDISRGAYALWSSDVMFRQVAAVRREHLRLIRLCRVGNRSIATSLTQFARPLADDQAEGTAIRNGAEHSKPCPDIFQTALARLDAIEPEEAIVIGDTPYDVEAAAKAGMQTIALLSGGFSEETLRESGALDVYSDIADLLEHYEETPLASMAMEA